MPVQHSPPARKTRSQARNKAFLTPTPRAPLDGNQSVPQLRAHLDRASKMELETTWKGPGEDGEEEEENSVGEEESDGTEVVPPPVAESQGTGRQTLAQSTSSSEPSIPPAFKTPSMMAPDCFDGTQPFKVRSFIQS
ncbi:hypothetical protein O181_040394 [Austropuccinia psidii MF-1]|uniref:Uncharacterized protein n=1 Tax=Austropuccinia psidii MF-1 TaxID=1389203 RepID=A0A9Q3HFG9_9BASI|nr:hypothetical protein [Austropuccinia psidii MF-1]